MAFGVGAFAYGAIAAWWGGNGPLSDLTEVWRESPSQYGVVLAAMNVVFALFVYAMVRVALPLARPRVTKRWRSEPLIMRTASLAQSIVFFRTLEAFPPLMIGHGLGMLFTAAAGLAGHIPNVTAPVLVLLATVSVSAGLASAVAKRQAALSNYKMLLRIW